MIEKNLAKLGFSPCEIKVYLFLLREGSSYPSEIAAKTRANRTNVYEALDRLVGKGIVSFITKNKVKWFEARAPGSIQHYIKEKEEEINSLRNSLIKEVSEIKSLRGGERKLEATIFVGKKGLRMIFEDILEAGKPISMMASHLQFKEVFGPYFELWHRQRIGKKIEQRSIFPKKLKGKLEKRQYLKYKFVDDRFASPTTTIIYGENCVFIQWSDEPVAVRLANAQAAKSQQNYFDMIWGS